MITKANGEEKEKKGDEKEEQKDEEEDKEATQPNSSITRQERESIATGAKRHEAKNRTEKNEKSKNEKQIESDEETNGETLITSPAPVIARRKYATLGCEILHNNLRNIKPLCHR